MSKSKRVADIGINGGGGGDGGNVTVTTDGDRINGVALNMFHTCNNITSANKFARANERMHKYQSIW